MIFDRKTYQQAHNTARVYFPRGEKINKTSMIYLERVFNSFVFNINAKNNITTAFSDKHFNTYVRAGFNIESMCVNVQCRIEKGELL